MLTAPPIGTKLGAKRLIALKSEITSHDVLEPLKQALWASRDVIISSQIEVANCKGSFSH